MSSQRLPGLDVLRAFATFAETRNFSEAARRLHLSVSAVSYRLDRIAELTGHDPADPAHRFTLHAAVLGARLLGWPGRELHRGDPG